MSAEYQPPKVYGRLLVNITLDDTFIAIESSGGKEPSIRYNGTLSGNENAALQAIVETARCLSIGKQIDHYFNPMKDNRSDPDLFKCKWERSGRLKILGKVTKRFQHASTVEQALFRRRVFTAYKDLVDQIPAVRPVKK